MSDCDNTKFSCGSQTEACVALELVCDGDCDCNNCLDENDTNCGEGGTIPLFCFLMRKQEESNSTNRKGGRIVQGSSMNSALAFLVAVFLIACFCVFCRCSFQL